MSCVDHASHIDGCIGCGGQYAARGTCEAPMSNWHQRARTAIALAIAQAQTNGADRNETIALIDAAYPFGPRKHHPYKVWLAERRQAIAAHVDPSRPSVAMPQQPADSGPLFRGRR